MIHGRMPTFASRPSPSSRLRTIPLPDVAPLGSRTLLTPVTNTDLPAVMLYLTMFTCVMHDLDTSLAWSAVDRLSFIGFWNTQLARIARSWRSSSPMLPGFVKTPSSTTGFLLLMVVFKHFSNGCIPLGPNLGKAFSRGTKRLLSLGSTFKVLQINGTRSLRMSWMASVCLALMEPPLLLHLFQNSIAIVGLLVKPLNSSQFMPHAHTDGADQLLGI